MAEPQTYIFVYQTINKLNGKTYIGVHKTTNMNDGYIGCGICKQSDAHRKHLMFHKAVIKYGYNCFQRYILSFYDTYSEALDEERYIVNMKWVTNNNNYNCALGGRSNSMAGMSDEAKKEMRRKQSVAKTGKKRTPESCERISAAKRGVKFTEAHKAALKRSNARHWLGKDRGAAFREKLSKSKTGVALSDYHKSRLSIAARKRPPSYVKPIIQFSKEGVFIKEHQSGRAAAREVGCLPTSINNNLTGYSKSCSGFVFKYKGGVN